jgi:hypothetical protein
MTGEERGQYFILKELHEKENGLLFSELYSLVSDKMSKQQANDIALGYIILVI